MNTMALKRVVGLAIIAGITAVFFQNCAPQEFSQLASSDNLKQVIDDPPPPETCSAARLEELYSLSVTTYSVPIQQFANNCVDITNNYSQIMASYAGFGKTRFDNTCAVRWCSSAAVSNIHGNLIGLDRGEALGAIRSQVIASGSQLNANQNVAIECRNNFQFINDMADSCLQVVQNKRPVESFELPFSGGVYPCGSNVLQASAYYNSGDPRTCATNYCVQKNDGFKSGLMTELNNNGVRIVCSRAN